MSKISLIRLSEPLTDGTFRVYARVTHRHGKAKTRTKITCAAKDSDQSGVITSMKIISQAYQMFLGEWEERLEEAETSGLAETMTAKELLDHISGEIGQGPTDIRRIDFLKFCTEHYNSCCKEGRKNSAMNFKCVENSLREYSPSGQVMVADITTVFLNGYVEWLRGEHRVTINNHGRVQTMMRPPLNGQSINNRIKDFKTLFNALKRKYCDPLTGEEKIRSNPFRFWKPLMVSSIGGYRATDADVIRTMNGLRGDERLDAGERLAIDMFLLSFCLMGMNATDLYDLRASDMENGRINYQRNKTKGRRADGAFISVEVPPLGAEIMRGYASERGVKLLDLGERYSEVDNLSRAINNGLKRLYERNIGIPKLTYYSARHTWATIARNECGVSREDIDLALNHTNASLKMADVYVRKDFAVNDRNNRKVMEFVFG